MNPSVSRLIRRTRRSLVILAAGLFVVDCQAAFAQAWVPPAGDGSVSISYQTIENTGHLLTNGFDLQDGKSTNQAVYLEAEYALSDRLSVSAGVPYVFAKYNGPGPTPFGFLAIDSCYCWHSAWQDFGFSARYNVLNANVGLTPFVSIGVPSHNYPFQGSCSPPSCS
jgi:hypothetical protein